MPLARTFPPGLLIHVTSNQVTSLHLCLSGQIQNSQENAVNPLQLRRLGYHFSSYWLGPVGGVKVSVIGSRFCDFQLVGGR